MDFYQQLLIKAQDPRYENEYVEVIERGWINELSFKRFQDDY